MKRFLTMALVATSILTGVGTAQADGWTHYHHGYVQYHFKQQLPDTPSISQLRHFRQARHWAIERAIHTHQKWVAAQRVEKTQNISTPPATQHHYGGSLQSLVCSYNWSCSIASCIVSRESQWDPHAYNRVSRAAGLWQWMPGWYQGHFDPFNPYEATAFAWHRYLQSGWSDWYSRRHPCY